MNKHPLKTILLAITLLLAGSWSSAQATIIYYKATDLADSIIGDDLWQYEYLVNGQNFLTDQGFDIFFPVSDGYQNGDLDYTPSSPNADWDVFSIQPELSLPAPHNGFFEAVALVDNAGLNDWFSLSFIWRGIGQPGSQAYDIIDTDLSIITSGRTVPYNPNPSVPEPAVWLLLLPGLVYFGSLVDTVLKVNPKWHNRPDKPHGF